MLFGASFLLSMFNCKALVLISTIEQFANMFNLHFIASKLAEKTASCLYMVIQKTWETLREYLFRFHKASLEILKLNDKVLVEYIKQGLNPDSAFFASISKTKHLTLQQVRKKEKKYIRQEELRSWEKKMVTRMGPPKTTKVVRETTTKKRKNELRAQIKLL